MHKFEIFGENILITSSHRIDETGFARACEFIGRAANEILTIKKSSCIILQDNMDHSFVIERMNTDTFTLHIQYEIKCTNVYQI